MEGDVNEIVAPSLLFQKFSENARLYNNMYRRFRTRFVKRVNGISVQNKKKNENENDRSDSHARAVRVSECNDNRLDGT